MRWIRLERGRWRSVREGVTEELLLLRNRRDIEVLVACDRYVSARSAIDMHSSLLHEPAQHPYPPFLTSSGCSTV